MKTLTGKDLFPLGPLPEEREKRFLARKEGSPEILDTFQRYLSTLNGPEGLQLKEAYEFALKLEYTHPGLTPTAYLTHPVRVATLAIEFVEPFDLETVTLSLIHNILEVTALTPRTVAEKFGGRIEAALKVLTVDRSRKDEEYKTTYYQAIQAQGKYARVVKALDKFDNLFLLCLNDDEAVRTQYLNDIEKFIYPFVDGDLPALSGYTRDLVQEARKIGFVPNPLKK